MRHTLRLVSLLVFAACSTACSDPPPDTKIVVVKETDDAYGWQDVRSKVVTIFADGRVMCGGTQVGTVSSFTINRILRTAESIDFYDGTFHSAVGHGGTTTLTIEANGRSRTVGGVNTFASSDAEREIDWIQSTVIAAAGSECTY